ncbi:MAG TPA: ribokinase [Propionibacteriaceae bacterium]|nr:ribokinase [Propionibacteriaceae bacterium]
MAPEQTDVSSTPAALSTPGVVVVGSISMDLTAYASRLPARGETILGDDFTLVLGGKGANQATAVARAGARAVMVGCVGDDVFATLATDALRTAGVDLRHVVSVPGATGVAHIRVDSSGENDIIVVPLANTQLAEDQIDVALGARADCSVLLTQLEVPWPMTRYAIEQGHLAGVTVILDPAPAAVLEPSVWPLVDLVTPNETEASALTGIDVVDVASAVAAGRFFTSHGARHSLITLGGSGAVLVSAEDVQEFAPIRVDAVDTTAAGDAFAGYLGASLALGRSLPDAISRAVAAGALAVTARGASASIPHDTDVDALLATVAVEG